MGKFWSSEAKPLDLYCFSSTSLGSKWDLYSEGPECLSCGPSGEEMEEEDAERVMQLGELLWQTLRAAKQSFAVWNCTR